MKRPIPSKKFQCGGVDDHMLDQPEFYRFPVVGPKRSQIVYLALEGTKNPSEELSTAS